MSQFNPKPGDTITVENGNKFTCCTHEQLNKRYQHAKDDYAIYGIACDGGHGWEGWEASGKNESNGYDIAAVTPGPAPEDLLPAPGERFITADGSTFLCVTPETLLKACPSAAFSMRNYVTLGLRISVTTGVPVMDWQGWPCKVADLKIVEIVRDQPAEPTSWAPEPGDTITTVEGLEYTCCTVEELAKALGTTGAHLPKRDYYGMCRIDSGMVLYLGWPLEFNKPKNQIASVTPGPEKPASTLPSESVQALAEARQIMQARQIMPTGQIEANKVYAAADKPKFNPKPGDTIITGNYAYVCCTREYLETHYGNKLSCAFDIYGYRPCFGTGTGASAMGWDAAGKSGYRETDDDIKTVITVLGNKPKFKGVTTKQNLLDHLASLDGDHVRIRVNDDHSISIE